MKKIKDLSPLVDKLKKKYGSDKLGFSKAQAELYKQKGINPSAGCLPYILQIVILIALFNVFTTSLSSNGDAVSKINNLLYSPVKLEEGHVLHTKFLYFDVTKPDTFRLPGVPFALPGLFLILAALAQFASVKITAPYIKAEKKLADKTKTKEDDMQVAMTQSMTYMMPLMTIFFGMSFPAGLALYWLIFSAVNVIQQVGTSGWGGLTPFANRLGLVKS
jgi:YidC/Oxa1 family membrane protein insertase